MQLDSVSSLNFNGIYKLKVNGINKVPKFIKEHKYIYRCSDIFEENNNRYMYAISSESKIAEHMFERDLTANKIPFWKSLPVNQILNKKIIEELFNITKTVEYKENWII